MRMTILAAAAAIAFVSVPAFSQDNECPTGTTKTSPDGSPVTCSADASDQADPGDQGGDQGGAAMDSTEAGQGVKDAVTEDAPKQ